MSFKEWKEVTLADISIDSKGSYGIAASAIEYSKELYTYLRITDITDDGKLIKADLRSVDDEKAEKYLLKPNDIVFARTGNSTGRSYFYDGSEGPLVFAGFLIKFSLDPAKVNPKFMRYYTLSEEYKGWTKSFSTGSTRGNINAQTYSNMKINLPPREQQDLIVSILSKLEARSNLNSEIILNLEEISRSLFKRWFIDFEFPNEEDLPYKSNGGRMVESELGEIPDGWKAGSLGEIGILSNEKINLDKSELTYNYIGLEHMPQGNIALGNWESSEKVSGIKSLFNKGDILFGKLRPYFKKVGIAAVNGVCSTDILVINPKKEFEKAYLLVNLIQDRFIEYTTSTATGTRMPRSGWSQISRYNIVIPSESTLNTYNDIISPMIDQIQEMIHENIYLEKLRDLLLPKLLSGEIEIPDESVVD